MTPEYDVEELFRGNADVQRCPFHLFDAIRATPGLYYSTTLNAYLVARHADALEVLSSPGRFSSRVPFGITAMQREREAIAALMAQEPELSALMASLKARRIPMLASADDPAHKRQRRIAQTAFTPRRVAAMEPWIRSTIDALIDNFPHAEVVDVVPALATPLPVRVIAHMLGANPEEHEQLKRWSDDYIFAAAAAGVTPSDLKSALLGQKALFAYFAAQIEARKRSPRDDLMTGILQSYQSEQDAIDLNEIVAMAAQLLVGGNETTSALIALCLLQLAQRPQVAGELRNDPAKIALFVEEIVGREGPAQANFRVATCDTTIGQVPINAGSQVMVMYNAANRDPATFGTDELQLDTSTKGRHVGFGFGEHFCIGAPLARLEAQLAVRRMLERFSHIEFASSNTLRFANTYISRALLALPLKLRS